MCVCTQIKAAALSDAVDVHLVEVPGVDADAGWMQQHAAQTTQSAFCRHIEEAGRVCLWSQQTRCVSCVLVFLFLFMCEDPPVTSPHSGGGGVHLVYVTVRETAWPPQSNTP